MDTYIWLPLMDTDNFYEDISLDIEKCFGKKVIGLIKDKAGVKIITNTVATSLKTYVYEVQIDDHEIKTLSFYKIL